MCKFLCWIKYDTYNVNDNNNINIVIYDDGNNSKWKNEQTHFMLFQSFKMWILENYFLMRLYIFRFCFYGVRFQQITRWRIKCHQCVNFEREKKHSAFTRRIHIEFRITRLNFKVLLFSVMLVFGSFYTSKTYYTLII